MVVSSVAMFFYYLPTNNPQFCKEMGFINRQAGRQVGRMGSVAILVKSSLFCIQASTALSNSSIWNSKQFTNKNTSSSTLVKWYIRLITATCYEPPIIHKWRLHKQEEIKLLVSGRCSMQRGQHWMKDILHPYNGWGKLCLVIQSYWIWWKLWSLNSLISIILSQENFYTLQDLKLFSLAPVHYLENTWVFPGSMPSCEKQSTVMWERNPNRQHENLHNKI
jgi:hypothetical protein